MSSICLLYVGKTIVFPTSRRGGGRVSQTALPLSVKRVGNSNVGQTSCLFDRQISADELDLDADIGCDLLPGGVRSDRGSVRAGGQRETEPISDPEPFRPGQRF